MKTVLLHKSYLTIYRYRFRTIIRPYYRGAAGIVLAYDVTDEKTFRNIEEWTTNIAENTQTCQIIPKVLIANKTDLDPETHRIQVFTVLSNYSKINIKIGILLSGYQSFITVLILFFSLFKPEEGRQLAERNGMTYLEGSAKDGTGIAEAFQVLAELIWHAQQVRRVSGQDQSRDDIIHLQEIPVYDKRQRKCCGGMFSSS